MADCTTMKKGEIYTCKDCGFTIQVVEECESSEASSSACSGSTCSFSCCGEDLIKKT